MICRWSMHYYCDNGEAAYECNPPILLNQQRIFDMHEPRSWSPWPGKFDHSDLTRSFQEALHYNSFSNIEVGELPFTVSEIVKAAQESSDKLLEESFTFAIMARNEDLLYNILHGRDAANLNVTSLFPFHLAGSYLDGSQTCCNLFDLLVSRLDGLNGITNLYVNDLGHTVLDNLMISILKSHTSCLPVTVDGRWTSVKRFAGEGLDVCGRWDVDSPSIQRLFASGQPVVPFEWKHMFCHTSAQTICHVIAKTFSYKSAPNINIPSGLFLKVCSHCKKSLQLWPLHCLVMIAFHLAQFGCEGETLFGILAILACLLAYGADPLCKAHISIKALLNIDLTDGCNHEILDPAELAGRLTDALKSTWSNETKLGWHVFCRVLRFAQLEHRKHTHARYSLGNPCYVDAFAIFPRDHDENYIDESDTKEYHPPCKHISSNGNFYGGSKTIGTLWAAIQTELVTYRKIEHGNRWISDKFDMRALLTGFSVGDGVSRLQLVSEGMMQPFCHCGRFEHVLDADCAGAQDACAYDFCNLEDVDRVAFISMPGMPVSHTMVV
jgi:hypothetical protein